VPSADASIYDWLEQVLTLVVPGRADEAAQLLQPLLGVSKAWRLAWLNLSDAGHKDRGVDFIGRMAGRQTHLQARIDAQAIAPEADHSLDPTFFGIKVEQVHSERESWRPREEWK